MSPETPPQAASSASAAPATETIARRGAESRRLLVYSVVGAASFVALLHVARSALAAALPSSRASMVLDLIVTAGFLVFLFAIFRRTARLQEELDLRNRELMALHGAALDIQGDLALDSVLQGVVDRARRLVGARYGALSVLGPDRRIQSFVTSGIPTEARDRIGPPPTGHGLLGVVLREGQRLRLRELGSDSRSAGFPEHHPPMRSLLAVPVPSHCRLPRQPLLSPIARTAPNSPTATGVHARPLRGRGGDRHRPTPSLHERLRTLAVAEERARIAHDLHDGTAQVLAYVNTKAQAADQFLRAGRAEEASAQLDELARAAREVYSDVREGILGLRSGIRTGERLEHALARYLQAWEQQSGVPSRLEHDGPIDLGPTSELQVLRVVQEALANVRKHAAANRVVVELRRSPDGATVEIRDDGAGFDPDRVRRGPFPHFGLATMRERAETIGARFSVQSAPGQGTIVRLELPAERPTVR